MVSLGPVSKENRFIAYLIVCVIGIAISYTSGGTTGCFKLCDFAKTLITFGLLAMLSQSIKGSITTVHMAGGGNDINENMKSKFTRDEYVSEVENLTDDPTINKITGGDETSIDFDTYTDSMSKNYNQDSTRPQSWGDYEMERMIKGGTILKHVTRK